MTASMDMQFDALLVLSFGGPEKPEDVRPFLENVTRGRGVPPERLDAVVEHYMHFGGVSPINALNRDLIERVEGELAAAGVDLPVYFGNRNWHPMVEDTVTKMREDGVRNAAVFATSAWGGYSGCRQYHEDIARAREAVGDGAPTLTKLRQYYDHPLVSARSPTVCARPAQSCPKRLAILRAWCSPRIRYRVPQTAMQGRRQRAETSTVDRSPRPRSWLPSRRRRGFRSGVAVAIRPAAGSVAGPRHL